jgi:hypothetical protein
MLRFSTLYRDIYIIYIIYIYYIYYNIYIYIKNDQDISIQLVTSSLFFTTEVSSTCQGAITVPRAFPALARCAAEMAMRSEFMPTWPWSNVIQLIPRALKRGPYWGEFQYLVGGAITILKNISQWEGLSHILWNIKKLPGGNIHIYISWLVVQ